MPRARTSTTPISTGPTERASIAVSSRPRRPTATAGSVRRSTGRSHAQHDAIGAMSSAERAVATALARSHAAAVERAPDRQAAGPKVRRHLRRHIPPAPLSSVSLSGDAASRHASYAPSPATEHPVVGSRWPGGEPGRRGSSRQQRRHRHRSLLAPSATPVAHVRRTYETNVFGVIAVTNALCRGCPRPRPCDGNRSPHTAARTPPLAHRASRQRRRVR
jgi:hypothetical protein